jgi:hypothetical protein
MAVGGTRSANAAEVARGVVHALDLTRYYCAECRQAETLWQGQDQRAA